MCKSGHSDRSGPFVFETLVGMRLKPLKLLLRSPGGAESAALDGCAESANPSCVEVRRLRVRVAGCCRGHAALIPRAGGPCCSKHLTRPEGEEDLLVLTLHFTAPVDLDAPPAETACRVGDDVSWRLGLHALSNTSSRLSCGGGCA